MTPTYSVSETPRPRMDAITYVLSCDGCDWGYEFTTGDQDDDRKSAMTLLAGYHDHHLAHVEHPVVTA